MTDNSMKVSHITKFPVETIGKSELEDVGLSSDGSRIFKSKLTSETKSAYLCHIQTLIGDIEKQGKIVVKRADMAELQKYREMITQLINETVSNGFVFQKEGAIGNNGRSKIFVMIRTINEKLDGMTKKLLEEEKDTIQFLNDVDDIRGLLIDMYM